MNFSVEFIFEDIRARLRDRIEAYPVVAPLFSNGLLRRLLIAGHARLKQGDVNHVTGDITFVAMSLDPSKTVVTVLDCGNVLRERGLRRWALKKFWLDLPVEHCAVVTTISEQARREILALTGCPASKVVVVPVAISDRFQFTPKPQMPAVPRILAVGTTPNKNHARLVQALEGVPCTLVIVGAPSDEIRTAIAAAGIPFENHVGLSDADMVRQYEECDLLAFPSTYEGFGMPILEAQAVGRPVVTSNCSSMPEVAADAACLVDPLDVASIREGVLRVIRDDALRHALVERGRMNVRRFEPQTIAEQYLAIYERVSKSASHHSASDS